MKKEEKKDLNNEKILEQEITQELKDSYLDYAMSVIVSRALPDVRDGLKPVQRRILWAMWDTGLTHSAKFKKSANVVGEVLGKYHPHGDMAVYDALARMAQDFSLRYPLIEGQGNWGSVDGDSPAAMRYTEARLSRIAAEMLIDIEKETVDWQSNYDNSRLEPKVLPAKLPNLLLNGAMGIAVGMATSIPPHNLKEVCEALIFLIEKPEAETKELMKFLPGPDFPTGGLVYDEGNLEEIYETGKGSILMRALTDIEEKKSGYQIIIKEIPYQVNKADLISKIAELVSEKKIEGIKDVRDESDREGLRVVIDLKSEVSPQRVLNQLYTHTDLQKKFYVNMLALVDGIKPSILSLKEVLNLYLSHRREVVRRRTEFDLKKAKERAHILEGLMIALSNIDKVIETIKKSKDRNEASENLIKKFKLTKIQSEAILEMKLQNLAALERYKIEEELKEKRKLIKELEDILANPKKIVNLIKNELIELKDKFQDGRRTKIISQKIKEFKEEDLIHKEDVIVILTKAGYLKRVSPTLFKAQKRGGKGLIGFDLKEEDSINKFIIANTHDLVLFFTNKGRVFQEKVYELPQGTRISKGKSIHNFLELNQDEEIINIISLNKNFKGYLVMVTKNGLIKKTDVKEFANIRKTGIWAIKLKKDDSLADVKISSGQDEIILITASGQAIRFKEKDLREMQRGASGVLAIKLKKNDFVVSCDIINSEALKNIKDYRLVIVTANGYSKQSNLKEYKVQKRGGKGIIAAKVTERTGLIVGAQVVNRENEEIIVFSKNGQVIKTNLKDIRLTGRAAQGVKIMNLEKNDYLVSVLCL